MLAQIAGVPTLVEASARLALCRGVAFPLAESRILLVVAFRCRQHLCFALVRQNVSGVYSGKCCLIVQFSFKVKGNWEMITIKYYLYMIPSM